MNPASSSRPDGDRRVKSVNFTDQALFDFAIERAENVWGGNFSAYVINLIERDRNLGEATRAAQELEEYILLRIQPFGGKPSLRGGTAWDFEVPSLNLLIDVKSRFPRARQQEYAIISQYQRALLLNPGQRIIVIHPSNLPGPEKERFRQLESAGIEGLRVIPADDLAIFLDELKHSMPSGTEGPGEILSKLEIPESSRRPANSPALYIQSFLTSLIHQDGGEVSIEFLAFGYDLLLNRDRVVKKLEAFNQEKVNGWFKTYCENPTVSQFLLSLKELASRSVIRVTSKGNETQVKLLKSADGSKWSRLDAGMIRAALKTDYSQLVQRDTDRVTGSLLPDGAILDLLAA